MHQEFRNYIKALVEEYQISFIPVMLKPCKKNPKNLSGKIPAISNWNAYEHELPTDEDIDSWKILGTPSGVAIVTGVASNLGCVDVDTEDTNIQKSIDESIPSNSPIVQGKPERGGKYLFKLKEYPNDEPIQKGKITHKDIGEIFSGGGLIVVPTAIHTRYENGDELWYEWKRGPELGEYPIVDELPLLTREILTEIKGIAQGLSKDMRDKNKPNKDGSISTGNGRWDATAKEVSNVVRRGFSIDQAIDHLYKFDMERNGADNMFFNQRRAGPYRLTKMNVLKYYYEMLKKSMLANNNGPIENMELPSNFKDTECKEFYDTWERPELPSDGKKELEVFNTDIIPEQWRALILDASDSNNVPPEACFFVMLVQLSSLIGNKRWIQAKKKNKSWNEAHNIWSIYVSKSGTRKSQILKVMGKPMKEIQENIDEDHKNKSKDMGMMKEIVEVQVKELKRRIEEEAKVSLESGGGTNPYIQKLQEQSEKLKASITNDPKRQLIVNSTTPEKFLELLSENPTGIMMVQNEIQAVINSFKKKGYEKFRQDLMDSWDGNQTLSMQTKTAGDIKVDNACLSLYGAMQPSLFEEEMNQIAGGHIDDGFWQRSFIVFNDKIGATEAIDIEFNYAKYHDAYSVLFKANDLEESENPIKLSEEAYQLYMDFETRVNTMADLEEVGAVASFWSKFTGKVVKVSSLLEFISTSDKCHEVVSAHSMRSAIYIMERQMNHIKNFFPSSFNLALKEVIYKIQTGIVADGITLNAFENQRGIKKYFGDATKSLSMMRELHGRGIIRAERQGKSTILRINPYLVN